MNCAGAILCGGQSSRMGEPKHDLVLPDGRTMIEAVAAAVGEVCERTIILGPDSVLPDRPHVHDLREGQGPLAGIEALLASGLDDQYLVVPCDVPLVTGELLGKMMLATSAAVTVFHVAGHESPECMPMRIAASALDEVRRRLDAGRRAVHGLFGRVEAETVRITADEAEPLRNVNAPDDFRALLDRM